MVTLQFDPSQYAVTYKSDTICLLAKEYALFYFLYQNRGQAFSREQLLDRVWKLETPTDRTVDDHVYRLRKKLKIWEGIVAINTVRSLGYSLTVTPPKQIETPSLQNQEFADHLYELLRRFHLYGQGSSLLALAKHQEELGIAIPPYYRMYNHFIEGDIDWFLETDEMPLSDRLYSILAFYFMIHFEQEKSLRFAEKVLERKILPHYHHLELAILDCLHLYAETGRTRQAIERLKLTHRVVEEEKLDGFVGPVAISETYLHLIAGNISTVRQKLDELEHLLIEAPYLRERGRYLVVKGLWQLRMGNSGAASALIDEGLEVLSSSSFKPGIWAVLHKILYYLQHHVKDERLYRKYGSLWADLEQTFDFIGEKEKIERKLEAILFDG